MNTKRKAAPRKSAATKQAAEIPSMEVAKEVEKIQEIRSPGVQKQDPLARMAKRLERQSKDFDVIINGKHRSITRGTYVALSRDPENYKIELPDNSPLKLVDVTAKPCTYC